MKPTAPLLALPCSGMKPPSPLRAVKGHFWAKANLQRCWWFQSGVQCGVQRCWRFQSCPVIASCARKSSPCAARNGCEREKVRPASPVPAVVREKVRPASSKRAKNAAFWCAGRTFSRKCCGTGCAGRTFRGRAAARSHREHVYVRTQSLRLPLISRGEISHAIPLKAFQVLNSNR